MMVSPTKGDASSNPNGERIKQNAHCSKNGVKSQHWYLLKITFEVIKTNLYICIYILELTYIHIYICVYMYNSWKINDKVGKTFM